MERRHIGFKYVDGMDDDAESWSLQILKHIEIDTKLLQKFDPCITDDIREIKKVLIEHYTDKNGINIPMNKECYDIEYYIKETNIQSFIYIPCDVLDNFIREQKLKRILE